MNDRWYYKWDGYQYAIYTPEGRAVAWSHDMMDSLRIVTLLNRESRIVVSPEVIERLVALVREKLVDDKN